MANKLPLNECLLGLDWLNLEDPLEALTIEKDHIYVDCSLFIMYF